MRFQICCLINSSVKMKRREGTTTLCVEVLLWKQATRRTGTNDSTNTRRSCFHSQLSVLPWAVHMQTGSGDKR